MILDTITNTVTREGRRYRLTPIQTTILNELMKHRVAGGLLTTSDLAVRVYGRGYGETDHARNNLRVQMSQIRRRVPGLIDSEQTAVHRIAA